MAPTMVAQQPQPQQSQQQVQTSGQVRHLPNLSNSTFKRPGWIRATGLRSTLICASV